MASARHLPSAYNTSTFGDGTRNYTSVETWQQANDGDLVTATAGEVLDCYDDATSFDVRVDIESWMSTVANASYFRVIRAATGEEHDGTPNNGVWINNTGTSTGYLWITGEDYIQTHDLILTCPRTNNGYYFTTQVELNAAFIGCIAWDSIDAGTGDGNGFGFATSGSFGIDCLAITCESEGFRAQAASPTLYNCTSVGNAVGFNQATSGGALAKNCLSYGNTTDWNGSFGGSSDYNASDSTNSPGANSVDSITDPFVSVAGDDYHLDSGDTQVKGQGVSLAADGTYAFDDDIDGETITTWSIGCDSIVAASFQAAWARGANQMIGAGRL